MSDEEWADRGMRRLAPLAREGQPRPIPAEEAWCLIRGAYGEGYLDALAERNGILDPCGAAQHLSLAIPVF